MLFLIVLSIMYILSLVIFLGVSLIHKVVLTNNQLTIIMTLSIISFSIIAYNTLPSHGTDLSRYYIELDNMRFLGFDYVLNRSLYHETFLANILFYLVSKTSLNGLLPAVSTVLTLGCFLYVLRKKINMLKPSSRIVSLFILCFLAITFPRAILTGVRQHWAWALLLLAIFFDFLSEPKKKKTSIMLYLAAPFIHVGTIPIILTRIYYAFTQKYKMAKYLIFLWPLAILTFGDIASSLGGIFEYSYEKLFIYSDIEYSDIRLYIVRITFFLLLLSMAFYINGKKDISYDIKFKKYVNFYLYIGLFGLASFNIPHLFSRFITFLIYMALPIFVIFFNELKNIKSKVLFAIIILIFVTGLLLYQVVDLRSSWRLVF